MFSYLYHLLIFNPLYNGLIFLFDLFPWMDAGFAVIIFTIIVRLILFPLSKKSIVTQVRMKEIEPELNKIRQSTTDRQKQGLLQMELYRNKGINPFSSFFFILIQLPIIFALYSIFISSGLPVVNSSLLYGFVNIPNIDMHFLGVIDISSKSFILAVLAAIAQYLQLHFSVTSNTPSDKSSNDSINMAADMMKNMKYIFPIMIFFIAYKISAVVAIYLTISSLFTLGQELVVRRHIKKHQPL